MSDENKMEVLPSASQGIVDNAKLDAYNFMNPARWQMIKQVAQTFFESGAIPASIKNAPQMVMVVQAGYECGLQPIESLNSFYFVNGKISMYGEMGIALVRRAGHKITWGKCDDQSAAVKITRGDTGEELESTFTMQMAISRGLTAKGGPWKSAPDNMLKYKAFWATARFLVPDALHNLPMKEELEMEVVPAVVSNVRSDSIKKILKPGKVIEILTEHKPLESVLEEPEEEFEVIKPKFKYNKPLKDEEKEIKPVKKESAAAKAMREAKEKTQVELKEDGSQFLIDNKEAYDKAKDRFQIGWNLTEEEQELVTKYEYYQSLN